MQRGFSTLEILLALAIMTITLSAVIMSSFSNQSLLISGQTAAEAMGEGQDVLEEQQALARRDFNLVVATTSVRGIYTRTVTVEQQSDLLTKKVTATVFWPGQHGEVRSIMLMTLVTNFNNAIGGDTCSSIVSGDWSHPQITSRTLQSLIATTTSDRYAISDVDAYKGRLYISAAKTTYTTDPTLFVFDLANPNNPMLLGYVDDSKSTVTGLNSLRIAENLASNKTYAYAASARSISAALDFGQLQVIDVTHPALVSWAPSTTAYKIAGVSGPGGVGNHIFYDNGYVYESLTTGTGPEFHVIDVRAPTAPYEIGSWPSTGSIGHDVNAVFAKDGFAYLAHPAGSTYNEQLTVLDVSNPSSLKRVGSFFGAPGIGGNGKSLYVLGDTVYLGRTASNISGAADSIPEWYALSAKDPKAIPATPLALLPLPTSGDSVNAVIARGDLAFLATNSTLKIVSATSTTLLASLALPSSGSSYEPSLDCENNTIYVASNDLNDNGTLSIVTTP